MYKSEDVYILIGVQVIPLTFGNVCKVNNFIDFLEFYVWCVQQYVC